jgi:erythromycin esterase-like protein
LFFGVWDEIRRRVEELPERDEERSWWIQLLKSTRTYFEDVFDNGKNVNAADGSRDAQMAENLLWLMRNRYQGRKVMVWGATSHFLKNIAENEGKSRVFTDYPSMGQIVGHELGNQAYAVGFVSSEGQYGVWRSRPVNLKPPDPDSLEGLFSSTDIQSGFLDLRRVPASVGWLHSPLVAGPLGYVPASEDWTKLLDGIIFIRAMTPSTRAMR